MRYVASCAICLDTHDDDKWVALDCGHLFHQTCAMQRVEYKNACSLCTKRSTTKGTIVLARTVFLGLEELSPSAAHATRDEDRTNELKRLGDLLRTSREQIALLEKDKNEVNAEVKKLTQDLKDERRKSERRREKHGEEKSSLESKIEKLKEQMDSKLNLAKVREDELKREKELLAQKVQRLNGMKRISDIGTWAEPDVQEFILACGDSKEDLTAALKKVYGEFKKMKDKSEEKDKKIADSEASLLAEQTKASRELKQTIDTAKMNIRKRDLKINELEARLMAGRHENEDIDQGRDDEGLVMLDSEEEPTAAPQATAPSGPVPKSHLPSTSKPGADYRNGVPGNFSMQQGLQSSLVAGGLGGGPSFIGRSVGGGNLSSFASSVWDRGAKASTSLHQNSLGFLKIGATSKLKRPAVEVDQPKIDSFFIKASAGTRQRTT